MYEFMLIFARPPVLAHPRRELERAIGETRVRGGARLDQARSRGECTAIVSTGN